VSHYFLYDTDIIDSDMSSQPNGWIW